MGFLLQKLISRLLFPVPLVVMMQAAALIALLLRRRRAALALGTAALALLATLATAPVADALLWNLERRHLPLDGTTVEVAPVAIVVMVSTHSERPELSGLHALSPAGTARVAEALRLATAFPHLPLWFTGGRVEGNLVISEVAAAAAVNLGVSPARITTDTRSRNTREEAAQVAQRLAAQPLEAQHAAAGLPAANATGPPSVILVTSASHMPRARALFAAAGVPAIAAPTDYRALGPPYALWSFLPSVSALHNSERAWYEYLGTAWARVQP